MTDVPKVYCKCGNAIPQERLDALPGTTSCVKCSTVPRKVGRLVYEHKTGGSLQVLEPEQAAAMREAESAVEERVSRL